MQRLHLLPAVLLNGGISQLDELHMVRMVHNSQTVDCRGATFPPTLVGPSAMYRKSSSHTPPFLLFAVQVNEDPLAILNERHATDGQALLRRYSKTTE